MEILPQRSIMVSYEAIVTGVVSLDLSTHAPLGNGRAMSALNGMVTRLFLKIGGKFCYRLQAVDQDGHVLDILLQSRHNKRAAVNFLRKLLQQQGYTMSTLMTNKLHSYGATHQDILSYSEHRPHPLANNRMENSHQPTRQQEWMMRRFKSPG